MALAIDPPTIAPSLLRVAQLQISPEMFVSVLQLIAQGHGLSVKGLPSDAQVVGAMFNSTFGTVELRLASETFAELQPGAVEPQAEVIFTDHGRKAGWSDTTRCLNCEDGTH